MLDKISGPVNTLDNGLTGLAKVRQMKAPWTPA